jgi:5-hydroxyisourate hydrolase
MKDVITCHILDTTIGQPARKVACKLSQIDTDNGGVEKLVSSANTDDDGRILNWSNGLSTILDDRGKVKSGTYKIHFETGQYLSQNGRPAFFPYVDVLFTVTDPEAHYHIPLLLSNYSYSTYRGS